MAEADPSIVESETDTPPAEKRRWGRLLLMISVPLALVIVALVYWQGLQGKVSTDNAYIQQNMVSVSAEVGGKIVEVDTGENQMVQAGDLLFRIDPSTYQLQVQQANAAIANAQANVTALSNSADLSGADIAAAREDIAFAQSRFVRQQQLMEKGFTTKADYDAAQHAVQQAREDLRQAQARQTEARARLAEGSAVPGENPQIAAAKAQKASAELALQRTEVRAPVSGRVAEADRLQVGNQMISNLPVLTIVEENSTYVEANFKETDLADMAVGQRAELSFDAYPGMKLKGHVSSIGAGTGSEFSVLPAQNASGNWVKVTQRVPVRIAIDEQSDRPLLAGLSTHVTIYTSGKE